jgi:hypothetical protein
MQLTKRLLLIFSSVAGKVVEFCGDVPLDATLYRFTRWPALLIRNRARAPAVEGVLTGEAVAACFRNRQCREGFLVYK